MTGCTQSSTPLPISELTAHNNPAGPSAIWIGQYVEELFGAIQLRQDGRETGLNAQYVPSEMIGHKKTVSLSRPEARIIGDTYYFRCEVKPKEFSAACGFVEYDPHVRFRFIDSAGKSLVAKGTIKRGKTIVAPNVGANRNYWSVWRGYVVTRKDKDLERLRKAAEFSDTDEQKKAAVDALAERIRISMTLSNVKTLLGKSPTSTGELREDTGKFEFDYPLAQKKGYRIRVWCSQSRPQVVEAVQIVILRPVFKSTKEIPDVPTDGIIFD